MFKNSTILAVIILSIAIILSANTLSSSTVSIKNTGISSNTQDGYTNAISVSGDGSAVVDPDQVTLTVSIQKDGRVSSEIQSYINSKVTDVLQILNKYNIDEKNTKTASLSISPRYSYVDRKRIFDGYTGTQSLTVKIDYDITKQTNDAEKIIDEIVLLEDVLISNVSFALKDKTFAADLAREQAYKSAEQKAKQLADLSGVKLGKPISITDLSKQYNAVNYNETRAFAYGEDSAGYTPTQLQGGSLEFNSSLSVVYEIL